MPSLPWSARQDVPSVEDTSLAALLDGHGLPAGAGAELRPVADVLAALTAPPAGGELAGLAAARAEFRRHAAAPARPRRSPRRRPGGLASRLGAKAAAAAAAAVMGLGGAAAAAYAGALPASWQQFAHRTIGAPAAHGADHDTPGGQGAAGSSAYRLCTAYQRALAHGTASQQAAAFRNLVKAAGGTAKVTSWCAAVPHPRSSPSGPHSLPHPTRPPARHRTGPSQHTGPPTPRRTGPPTARPSSHPAGRPSHR